MQVVCRTSNRLFVGLPLCGYCNRPVSQNVLRVDISTGRDPDYIKLNIQFTIEVAMAAQGINLFPDLLKPYEYILSLLLLRGGIWCLIL